MDPAKRCNPIRNHLQLASSLVSEASPSQGPAHGSDGRTRRWLVAGLTLVGTLQACGPVPAAERGSELARDPRLSASATNAYACTTCHSTSAEEEQARLLPGYSLVGASQRPTLWNGGLTSFKDAVSQCLVDFMRGEPLATQDGNGLALLAYLQTLPASPSVPALSGQPQPCTVVRNIDDPYLRSLPTADATRGAQTYQRACALCHGQPHTGEGRLGPRFSVLPEDTIATFGAQSRAVIAEKVRHGKYFGIGGLMPFYCTERLSDGQLADLLGYLVP